MNKIFAIKDVDSHHIYYVFGYPILKVRHKAKNIDSRTACKLGLDTETRSRKLIVSLTTFPARINKVHITIENLLTQTLKPDKLILWLTEKEFPNKEQDLPESLLRLKEYGLTISWCEYMRSYQKIIPTLREYPDDVIVTFDDDFYYPKTILEDLYISYLRNPDQIHAHRAWHGELEGNYLNYSSCNNMYKNEEKYRNPSYFNFLMGYGGVLYPPNSLHKEVLNVERFMKVIPTHDDIWLWAMSVLGRTKTRPVNGFKMSINTIEDTQKHGLCNINKKNNTGIDAGDGVNKLIGEFPELLKILKEEVDG